jgi:RimJ/RimL family protein N-acetyltransferase
MIETDRLILRELRDNDREAVFAVNGDSRVNSWLGGPIDRAQSDASLDRISAHIRDHGFSFWGAEYRPEKRLIGMIGLGHMPTDLPPAPAIEIGWRLAPDYWGRGLAVEGATAVLKWAFANLAIDEVVAITSGINARSQAVMRRIGMLEDPSRGFDHPRVGEDDPLRRHVLYAAHRSTWRAISRPMV